MLSKLTQETSNRNSSTFLYTIECHIKSRDMQLIKLGRSKLGRTKIQELVLSKKDKDNTKDTKAKQNKKVG